MGMWESEMLWRQFSGVSCGTALLPDRNAWLSNVETHTGLTQNHEGGIRMDDNTGRACNKLASVQRSNESILIPRCVPEIHCLPWWYIYISCVSQRYNQLIRRRHQAHVLPMSLKNCNV